MAKMLPFPGSCKFNVSDNEPPAVMMKKDEDELVGNGDRKPKARTRLRCTFYKSVNSQSAR